VLCWQLLRRESASAVPAGPKVKKGRKESTEIATVNPQSDDRPKGKRKKKGETADSSSVTSQREKKRGKREQIHPTSSLPLQYAQLERKGKKRGSPSRELRPHPWRKGGRKKEKNRASAPGLTTYSLERKKRKKKKECEDWANKVASIAAKKKREKKVESSTSRPTVQSSTTGGKKGRTRTSRSGRGEKRPEEKKEGGAQVYEPNILSFSRGKEKPPAPSASHMPTEEEKERGLANFTKTPTERRKKKEDCTPAVGLHNEVLSSPTDGSQRKKRGEKKEIESSCPLFRSFLNARKGKKETAVGVVLSSCTV